MCLLFATLRKHSNLFESLAKERHPDAVFQYWEKWEFNWDLKKGNNNKTISIEGNFSYFFIMQFMVGDLNYGSNMFYSLYAIYRMLHLDVILTLRSLH